MVVSVCAVTAFYCPAPASAIPFLYFQTVAEVVKELEKNEKIRVQLECNKPGENVSADLGPHRGVASRNCRVGTESACPLLFCGNSQVAY